MKEKNYGGAFDIDPHSFWTRDDVDELACAVEESLQAQANNLVIRIDESYIDHENVIEIVFTHQGALHTVKQQVDMRKIQSPNDLNKKYTTLIVEQIIQVIKDKTP